MPPLRVRGDDILDMAYHFLSFYAQKYNKPPKEFSENAAQILLNYHWPGNIRELQNIMSQLILNENTALILGAMISPLLSNQSIMIKKSYKINTLDIHLPLWKIEKQAIENILRMTKGDVAKAAIILDVAPSTIYRKIKQWGKD